MSYNLLHEPWIPVVRTDGSLTTMSLLECFENASDIRKLSGDLPTQPFALLRLMLAVCHDAIGFHDDDQIDALLADGIDTDLIRDYLLAFEDRFDLFDPTRPFFQIAGLSSPTGNVSGLEKLIADVPNGEPFLTVRGGKHLQKITAAEAARWLVHCQAFDPNGIRTGVVGDTEVKSGKSYPIGPGWAGQIGGIVLHGRNLSETLAYNIAPTPDHPSDRPVWALDSPARVDRPAVVTVLGPVAVMTWQSRWLRLVGDRNGVTGVVISNAQKMTPQNRQDVEFMTAWRFSDPQTKKFGHDVYMPNKHDPDRSAWRGAPKMLGSIPAHKSGVVAAIRPETLRNLGDHAADHNNLDLRVGVETVGMNYGTNEAIVDELVHDSLDLRVSLLGESAAHVREMLNDCIDTADGAVWALGRLAGTISRAAGDFDGVDGAQATAREQGWAVVDAPARRWIADLSADTDTVEARRAWHRLLRDTLTTAARDIIRAASPAAVAGRSTKYGWMTAAKAEAIFWADLRKQLPLAYPSKQEETTS